MLEFFFFFLQDKILLYPNLNVYVCEAPSWRLEPRSLPPTLHKHLYLWSDHRTKGVRWIFLVLLNAHLILNFFFKENLILIKTRVKPKKPKYNTLNWSILRYLTKLFCYDSQKKKKKKNLL